MTLTITVSQLQKYPSVYDLSTVHGCGHTCFYINYIIIIIKYIFHLISCYKPAYVTQQLKPGLKLNIVMTATSPTSSQIPPTTHSMCRCVLYNLLRTTLMEARHTVVCVVYIFSPVASVIILDLIFTFLSYVYS